MKPSFLDLFRTKLTRDRVVLIISALVHTQENPGTVIRDECAILISKS
jgi:hypothetical protein